MDANSEQAVDFLKTRRRQIGAAALVALLAAGAAYWRWVAEPRSMRQAVIQALADDEFASAKSEAERLVARQPSDRESALLLAQAADGLEDETTVKRLLPKFAPPDDRGLPEGHLWRADRLLKRA